MFRLFAAPDLPERRCRWTQIWGKAFLRLNGRAASRSSIGVFGTAVTRCRAERAEE